MRRRLLPSYQEGSSLADVLTTVLQLVGGQQYVRTLNQATRAHQQLARAQQTQARAQAQMQAAMAAGRTSTPRQQALAGGAGLPSTLPLSGGMIAAGVGVAAISAVAIAVKDAENSFIDYDRAVIRTELTLKNMGQNLPTDQFTAFAHQLSQTTGTAEVDLVNLTGYMARFGTDTKTTERAMRVFNNIAILTGGNVEDIARRFEMARRGRAATLFKELGINVKAVNGQLYDLNTLLDLADLKTHDVGVRMGRELPGQIDRTTASFEALKREAGRLFGPATAQTASWTRQALNLGTRGISHLNDWLGFPKAGIQNQAAVPGQGLGGPGKPRGEEYLRKIEMNTGPQGHLGRALRAGGSFSEPGAGLHIRTLQQMLRHHT